MTDIYAPYAMTIPRRLPAVVTLGVWIMMVSLTFLDRFGVPVGDQAVSFSLVTVYVGVFLILMSGEGRVDPLRGFLYLCSFVGCIFAALFSGTIFSFSSFALLLVLYLPFVVTIDVTVEEYKRFINVWQQCMLVVVAAGVFQFITQDKFDLIKQYFGNYLVSGFNTRPVLNYGSTFQKSDGLFLLEPSFLSQFCSIALTLELIYFKKPWRIAAYIIGMICSVSLSGVAMIGVFLAFYAWRYKKIPHVVAAGCLVLIGMWAFQDTEVVGSVLNRSNEISGETNSSSYVRFVGPLVETGILMDSLQHFLVGVGPGNSTAEKLVALANFDDEQTGSLWPPLKLMVEYGVLGAVPMCTFLWVCFVSRTRSYIVSIVMLILYVLMSASLLLPQVAYVVLILVSLFPLPSEDLRPI